MRRMIVCALMALSVACSSPKPHAKLVEVTDGSSHFPQDGLVKMDLVPQHLLGKTFMPGGNLATYAMGYQQFLGKMPDAQQAAFLLIDWKKALNDATYLPHMGGYAGTDAGRPVYVFTKGAWVAGIVGLPQKQADTLAREFAARL